jgi:hypothetical protein
MRTKCSNSLAIALACAGAMAFGSAAAQRVDLGNGWAPSALEISQLPDYCQAQFISKMDWKVFGHMSPGCNGIHHFCAAQVLLLRVPNHSIPKGERRRILGQAKNEVNYLSSRLTPNCKRADEVRAVESRIRMHEMLLK